MKPYPLGDSKGYMREVLEQAEMLVGRHGWEAVFGWMAENPQKAFYVKASKGPVTPVPMMLAARMLRDETARMATPEEIADFDAKLVARTAKTKEDNKALSARLNVEQTLNLPDELLAMLADAAQKNLAEGHVPGDKTKAKGNKDRVEV